ncbi:hypothetical protein [Methylobacterium sp. SI9]|uniref:hypothetical protein n=1 Tax=Methylobacterium guangdongense TaxID=3138811 RepID=UPI00313DC00A
MSRKFLNGIDAQSQRVQNVAAGTQPADAVNLAQIQSLLAGLSWHGAVRAASTGNVTVSSPGASLDGVTMAAGNRVLLKNQTTATENGVYIWNGSSSALTRAADGGTGNLNAGAAFYVDEGTTNADTAWTVTTDDPITVGSTSVAFAKFGVGVAYTAGSGLTLTGQAFAVDATKIPSKMSTNVGDGSSTSITVTHSLGTLDVQVQVYATANGETVECDVTRPTTNTVALAFASAPASGAYRAVIFG